MSETLTKWEHPDSYAGFSPIGDYVLLSKTRDSLILDEVNFDAALSQLRAESEECDETFYTFRASHWACGWVEYLIVAKSAPEAVIAIAEDIDNALADYPSLDDDALSQKQFDAIHDYWAGLRVVDRVDHCKDVGASIFAARRDDEIPSPVFDDFQQSETFH